MWLLLISTIVSDTHKTPWVNWKGSCRERAVIVGTAVESFPDVFSHSRAVQPSWLEPKVADVGVASAVRIHPGTTVFIVVGLFGATPCTLLTNLLQV